MSIRKIRPAPHTSHAVRSLGKASRTELGRDGFPEMKGVVCRIVDGTPVAVGAFRSQFSFTMILFGAYLVLLGWLFWRSTYLPRWLGIVLAIDGLGWILLITGRYVGVNLEFLFVTSLGELVVVVWLIGWGTRLPDWENIQ